MLEFTDRQYKILVLGDIQTHGLIDESEKIALKKLMRQADPNLVVFLGDMISGVGGYTVPNLRRMIHGILDATVGTAIPFAIVSGNHEFFTPIPFTKQIELYREYPNCLTPSRRTRACRKAYSLNLCDSKKQPLFRLFFIDCEGSKATRLFQDYRCTSQAVLKYTREVLFSPDCPPTVVFQHITVPDVRRIFRMSTKDSNVGVLRAGLFPGKERASLRHPEAGVLGECPTLYWEDSTQFSDWAKSQKVRAAVFAHDHLNSFEDEIDGIKIIQCSCAGLSCYGNDDIRGARLVTISRSGEVSSTPLFYKNLQ